MTRFRKWLARKLDPQIVKDEDATHRMMLHMADDRHWLAQEFPEAYLAMTYLLERDNYWRRGKSMNFDVPIGISEFREHLRDKARKAA